MTFDLICVSSLGQCSGPTFCSLHRRICHCPPSSMICRVVLACCGLVVSSFVNSAPQGNSVDLHFPNSLEDFYDERTNFVQEESHQLLGARTKLETEDERRVNEILMHYKAQEYHEGLFEGGKFFGGSAHFFHAKPLIEASNIFKIIRTIPKGGALHIHETSAVDPWFIIKNFTSANDLFYCSEGQEFHFYDTSIQKPPCGKGPNSAWVRVNELRRNASSNELFDKWLFEKFSLVNPTPHETYPDINTVWKHFEDKVSSTGGIIKNVENREAFLTGTLKEFYDDNVMYVEFRSGLSSMYKKNGVILTPNEAAQSTMEVVNKFKKSHPHFWGAKYIFTTHRFKEPEAIVKPLEKAVELMKEFPDFVVGFDLVGQEDRGNPLKLYIPQLYNAKKMNNNLKYYFHAGETDWKGSKIDDNLLDAILLNTSRFGHGFSLPGRPQLMEIVKARQTGVELCPISNQVLGLVDDFRNHPASQLMRAGFPIVVSSDDPGVWGASGLSHDWYITFMAIAGERDDLRFLKQLAINSIQLSAMSEEEKRAAMTKWTNDWNNAMRRILDWSKAKPGSDFPRLRRKRNNN